MIYFVYTPRPSKSARRLAKALKGKRVKDLNFSPSLGDIVINWGSSAMNYPRVPGVGVSAWNILNFPEEIQTIANKLLAFRAFRDAGVAIPKFAETPGDVSWDGMTVVRHKLTGHSGEGIELVLAGNALPEAPLYVEYVKKQEEYRIHVGRKFQSMGSGSDSETVIIAVQRKARNLSHSNPNWQIRNHHNGFVYVREGVNPPATVIHEATKALVCSGLDFGAVDVVWNAAQGKAYVLEINTAPGLEGQTVDDYASFFKEL